MAIPCINPDSFTAWQTRKALRSPIKQFLLDKDRLSNLLANTAYEDLTAAQKDSILKHLLTSLGYLKIR